MISTIHQERRNETQVHQLTALTPNLPGVHRIPRVLMDHMENARRKALTTTIQHLTIQIRKLAEGPYLWPFITIDNINVALRIQFSKKWLTHDVEELRPVLHQGGQLVVDPNPWTRPIRNVQELKRKIAS